MSPAKSIALPRITWRRVDLPFTDFANVTTLGGRFFTIGDVPDGPLEGQATWTSADGIEWSRSRATRFNDGVVTRLRGLDDRLVAIVRHSFEAEPFGISTSVWWSKDARRWGNVIPRVDGRPIVFDVARFGRHWFATTTGPTALGSWNGTEPMQPVAGIDGSAFDRGRPIVHAGRLVIPLEGAQINAGNPTAVMLSTADGKSWIETPLAPRGAAEVLGMASDGSVLVAMGNGSRDDGRTGSAAWWTRDGLVWTSASLPAELLDAPRRNDAVAVVTGGFIALSQKDVGGPPDVIWSRDGRSWHLMPASGPDSHIALPRAFGVDDRALFYLQPYEELRWYLWEARLS